jgi:hypothetical protein
MIATVNSFAVPILSLAIVALSAVVFHLNRKIRHLDSVSHLHGTDCFPLPPVYTDDKGKPTVNQPFQ